jgi:hypothetical protein
VSAKKKKPALVHDNGNGTVTITLRHPVSFDGKTFEKITMRQVAMVPDLEAMDKGEGDVGKTKHLISELSSVDGPGFPVAAFGRMHASDYMVLAAEASKSLDDEGDEQMGNESRQTGASS